MDDTIVKFCEDRRSWLVVIAGTLTLVLVFVLPQVDDYVAVCREKTEVARELTLAQEAARLLPGYEQRYTEQSELLAEQLAETLTEENEAEYRSSLVKLIRDSGCQLRRLNISPAVIRDWGRDDDPLEKTYNKKLKPTGYQLQRRQVSLTLSGPTASVRRLIERFEQHDKQVHLQTLDLKPSAGNGRRVELTMELWYFTLERTAA